MKSGQGLIEDVAGLLVSVGPEVAVCVQGSAADLCPEPGLHHLRAEPSKDGSTVPKHDFVARVETLLPPVVSSSPRGLKLAPLIQQELVSFRAKVSAASHHAYEAGGDAHDDLVLALALAVWGADESSPEALEKLTRLNRSLGSDNIYDRPAWPSPGGWGGSTKARRAPAPQRAKPRRAG